MEEIKSRGRVDRLTVGQMEKDAAHGRAHCSPQPGAELSGSHTEPWAVYSLGRCSEY